MELILIPILAIIGLALLWAAAAIFMAVASFLMWFMTVTVGTMAAFFTGRWLWAWLSRDYPEEDKADRP